MRVIRAVILVIASAIAHGAEPEAPLKPAYEPPKQLKLDLDWPGAANREAYVIVEFDVLANGRTANVQVADGCCFWAGHIFASEEARKKVKTSRHWKAV